jgi:outer membrane receptor protein involved in Fe transport
VYQKPFTSVDLSVSKELYDGWKLNVRAANMLNAARERYYSEDAPFSITTRGTTYSVSISKSW